MGTTGEVVIGLVEQEQGLLSDSDSVQVLRTGAAAAMEITNLTQHVAPNGGTANLEVWVYDSTGANVADGTAVSMSVLPGGSVVPVTGITQGASVGTMTVKAQANGVTATIPVDVSTPGPNQLTLAVSPHQLAVNGTATVTATVRDRWGNPMANQSVRIGVEGDGQGALFNGNEVVSALTNASGQVVFTLNGGTIPGKYPLRAELLVNNQPVKSAREEIWVEPWNIFMPLVHR